ncbi:hypothetical protein NNRS527_01851 [Nitrosospira sp. NRS527]|nr:hypothetical protein NNRS527_01851 [Nitrosospira sp. NRS527]
MPVFFLLGRYDRHVPATLAEQFFARIKVPFKCLVWFEQSSHNPPFEEPAKFNQVLIGRVLPLSEPISSFDGLRCAPPILPNYQSSHVSNREWRIGIYCNNDSLSYITLLRPETTSGCRFNIRGQHGRPAESTKLHRFNR